MDCDWQQTRTARAFAGRLPELDALAAALTAARAGEPKVVLVQGEAGIGKSSLILEFLGSQRGLPAIIASGEAARVGAPFLGWSSSWRPGRRWYPACWHALSFFPTACTRTRIRWRLAWSCAR